jgi:LCP family protein required for cell wall assembly
MILKRPSLVPKKRTGCLIRALMAWFIASLGCCFICSISFAAYLLFPPQHTDILVMGLDSREGEGFVARSDSILLLGIEPGSLQVSMISFPRDMFIDVPNYGLQRINTINFLGELEQSGNGPLLLNQSLGYSFGVQAERYVRFDFDTFVTLVDAVGGITIDVPHTIIDAEYPTPDGGTVTIQFDPGVQHMDGAQALIYARTRHGSDDYQRAERQQQVVTALTQQFVNPMNWTAVANVLGQSVDTNLSLVDLMRLAPPVVLDAGHFDTLVINRDYLVGSADGHALPNYDLILPWLDGRFN